MTALNEEDVKKNVKDKDTWVRFLFIAGFGIAFYVSLWVLFIIAIFQFLAKLFGGSPFAALSDFGHRQADFHAQVTRYMTFASDERPWPFPRLPAKE